MNAEILAADHVLAVLSAHIGAERGIPIEVLVAELQTRNPGVLLHHRQVRRLVESHSESFEQPDQLVRWYYGDPARLAEVEALVMEDNVVEWAMGRMKVEDTPTDFDELMGTRKG